MKDYNLILISIDSLRSDHLGCYGYSKKTSPNIDKLSKKSYVFYNMLAQSSWTIPSHASIFTGLYPSNHGSCGLISLNKKLITLAEVLASQDYYTISFNGNGYLSKKFGFHKGFKKYNSNKATGWNAKTKKEYTKSKLIKPIKNAISWIEENSTKKFFLFLHTFEVHAPYCGKNSLTSPEDLISLMYNKNKNCLKKAIENYDEEIRFTDYWIGKLVKTLNNNNLMEKTIIILTSDHGEGFLEHNLTMHSTKLYEEFLKIPLIIWNPKDPNYKKIVFPSQSVDIMPSILDFLEIKTNLKFDGYNLFSTPCDNQNRIRFVETFLDPGWGSKLINLGFLDKKETEIKMIAKGNWRLIYNHGIKTFELYNLKKDPNQLVNLIDQGKEIEEELKIKLLNFMKKNKIELEKEVKLEKKMINQLKKLGYF